MSRLIAPLPLVVLLVCGCASGPSGPRRPPPASLNNPASMACVQGGGSIELRHHPDGEAFGACRLPDGKICEEWALYQDKLCLMPRESGCPGATPADYGARSAGACAAAPEAAERSARRAKENALPFPGGRSQNPEGIASA